MDCENCKHFVNLDGNMYTPLYLSEEVNHPKHYNTTTIEVIEIIEEFDLGFNLGNVIKYILRAEHKGNKEKDLRKARWYIERELSKIEKEGAEIE
jgi:hypothetical protein